MAVEESAGDKERLRNLYRPRREALRRDAREFLLANEERLLDEFAAGRDVSVASISPEIREVTSDVDSKLYRYACLQWSVPVTGGYGRRTRFLVRDRSNGKLIGVFALSDPVYNLSCRDDLIGWDQRTKKQNLYRVLDASVLGAVPPYSGLLGGKLIALAILSKETLDVIQRKYQDRRTLIRGRKMTSPRPVLITTTSALGRSSIYNRLRIQDRWFFQPVGWTKGFGHFQLPDELFVELLRLMEAKGMGNVRSYKYGDGPNWKMRMLRVGLEFLGLDEDWLRHGVPREVFLAPTAKNWRRVLTGENKRALWYGETIEELSRLFLDRWALPRAERIPTFRSFDPQSLRMENIRQLRLTGMR